MHRFSQIGLLAVFLSGLGFLPQVTVATELPTAVKRKSGLAVQVQAILKVSCFSCHGTEEQESGLRLDSRQRAIEGGDGGRVIVPGDADSSRLLGIVSGKDGDVGIMPPEGEGTPLSAAQIAILRAWIEQGATWPSQTATANTGTEYWSFQPIKRPPIPAVTDRSWTANPIDAFVLARLESEGIAPSPRADRATLIKRLYLDLLGLPPAPADVNKFVGDPLPNAYERLVERVLASPHFGERWGRHWLDLARYADSDGYEKDRARPHAWRYRNWVIDSINADLPFDQFTIRQIAGDMLADATMEQRVASGFHRNTLHNTEGGSEPEEDRVKKTVDRTNTLGTIWLGLTVGCCQCHSHKYDPLTQREYYSLYAFFNSINEADIDAPLAVDRQKYQLAKRTFDEDHARLVEAVNSYEQTKLPDTLAAWEATALETAVVWQPLDPSVAASKNGAALHRQDDFSYLAEGTNQGSDIYTIEATVEQQGLTAIRLEVLPDDSLPKKGPGRADNGNFVLTTFRVQASRRAADSIPITIGLHQAQASFSQQDWPVAAAINDDPRDGWAISPQAGQRHVAVYAFEQPAGFTGGTKLTITLDQNYQGGSHNLGRFRLSVTSAQAPLTLEGLPRPVAAALAIERSKRVAEEREAIRAYFKTVDPEFLRLNQVAAEHAKKAPKSSGVKAQTVAQTEQPRETRIHIRGDFLNKGQPVQAAAPSVLHPLQPRRQLADRLDLANWIVAPANPLTARVTVNRIWQRFFGRGIVNTVDDFGAQGDSPSHPRLLDWLASEFRDFDWSTKRIQRAIVLSSTYQQSSAIRPELLDVDPENAILARQIRRRVESEVIRDLALRAAGLLDSRVGGPSVRPRQPGEYSALTYANSARWQVSGGGDGYRRGLYTFFQRTSPYPMLMTFDSPDANACCAQRSLSNTPLQALTLWNDPVFFECAQEFGRRVLRETRDLQGPDSASKRATHAFQLALGRKPSAFELVEVLALYDAQLKLGLEAPETVAAINGERPGSELVSPEEVASWIVVGRTIMNLDEFITKE